MDGKQNSGSAGLYSIPRRLLYQDHGGGKLSRVRQHRESGLPLMGCCRSDRSRKGGGDKCKPSGLACSIPLSLLPPLGGREGVKPLPRAGRKQHAVQQRKYEFLFDLSGENTERAFDRFRHRNVFRYRTRTIKAGNVLEVEIFPIWNTQNEVREAKKHTTREAQKNLNDKNAKRSSFGRSMRISRKKTFA